MLEKCAALVMSAPPLEECVFLCTALAAAPVPNMISTYNCPHSARDLCGTCLARTRANVGLLLEALLCTKKCISAIQRHVSCVSGVECEFRGCHSQCALWEQSTMNYLQKLILTSDKHIHTHNSLDPQQPRASTRAHNKPLGSRSYLLGVKWQLERCVARPLSSASHKSLKWNKNENTRSFSSN